MHPIWRFSQRRRWSLSVEPVGNRDVLGLLMLCHLCRAHSKSNRPNSSRNNLTTQKSPEPPPRKRDFATHKPRIACTFAHRSLLNDTSADAKPERESSSIAVNSWVSPVCDVVRQSELFPDFVSRLETLVVLPILGRGLAVVRKHVS
jgi:hypothetical protein